MNCLFLKIVLSTTKQLWKVSRLKTKTSFLYSLLTFWFLTPNHLSQAVLTWKTFFCLYCRYLRLKHTVHWFIQFTGPIRLITSSIHQSFQFTYPCIYSLIHSPAHPFTHLPIQSSTHHSFIHPFIHPCIHSSLEELNSSTGHSDAQ